MVRKMHLAFLGMILVLSLSIPAMAVQTGSIQVSLDVGELPVTNGSLSIYRVGIPTSEGYCLLDGYGGGFVTTADAVSPHLARWLAEMAVEPERTIFLDVDGNVTFSNLEEGLYLITQEERMDGFYPIESFLMTLPDENQWQAKAGRTPEPIILENPQTGQPAAPILGAMGLVISGIGIYLCIDGKRKK